MKNLVPSLPATIGDLVALAVDQARMVSSDPVEVARLSSRTVTRALRSAVRERAVAVWPPRAAIMSW